MIGVENEQVLWSSKKKKKKKKWSSESGKNC